MKPSFTSPDPSTHSPSTWWNPTKEDIDKNIARYEKLQKDVAREVFGMSLQEYSTQFHNRVIAAGGTFEHDDEPKAPVFSMPMDIGGWLEGQWVVCAKRFRDAFQKSKDSYESIISRLQTTKTINDIFAPIGDTVIGAGNALAWLAKNWIYVGLAVGGVFIYGQLK